MSETARYIDAEKLVAWCNETFQAQSTVTGKAYVNAFLTEALSCTTADAVPRAEVEELKVRLELEQKAHESLKELYRIDIDALVEARRKTEVEVAREIFEEFGKLCCTNAEDYDIFLKLKKKYTEGGDQT